MLNLKKLKIEERYFKTYGKQPTANELAQFKKFVGEKVYEDLEEKPKKKYKINKNN